MSRYLITGSSGFVGRKFIDCLCRYSGNVIAGIDISEPSYASAELPDCFRFFRVDMRDKNRLCKIVYDFKPDFIVHLASYSSVRDSWKSPEISFQNNLNTFVNLVESVRSAGAQCRILSVGSSEEYGNVELRDLPLKEDQSLNPASPFGIARYSQELVARLYSDVYGLDIVMTRSFNHIGPGMNSEHAASSFAAQLLEIRHSGRGELLVAGDTSIVRDFVDVEDVVRAYDLLLKHGRKGETYNVCSGTGISLHNMIRIMCDHLQISVTVKENRQLLRPKDNAVIIGSNEKIRRDTGWTAEVPFEESVKRLLDHFGSRYSGKQFEYSGLSRKY